MRNITVSVDEETHRFARIRAAELDISVSALVRNLLRNLAESPDSMEVTSADSGETVYQRRCRLLRKTFEEFEDKNIELRKSNILPREAVYDRAAARAEATAVRERERSISEALGSRSCDS